VRLLRRNVVGVYAVYAATIVSGLVVTPITLHALGDDAFGIWSFIGSLTVYLALLDFGLGPSVVRFTAEARGRRAPEDTNRLVSVALVLYAVIGLLTVLIGIAISWLAPLLIDAPDDLVWDTRLSAFLLTLSLAARFPLGLFYNLLGGHQRFDVQNLANFVGTIIYAVLVAVLLPRGGGLVLLGVLTLAITLFRLGLPLFWLRREFPGLHVRRSYVTRERVRELVGVSTSNFLVHIAQKVVFSTDVIVVGIVLGATAATLYALPAKLFQLGFGLCSVGTTLMFPAFAEHEGAGEADRQRRLLLVGIRGSMAAALVVALPLLLMPDYLIEAWVRRDSYGESSPVLVLLAVVLLIHQPIYLLTNYLIARGRQREIAWTLLCGVLVNVVLSLVLVKAVGIWGVALATLVTDLGVLLYVVPVLAAPAAGISVGAVAQSALRPFLPAAVVAVPVLGLAARAVDPDTLLELIPFGAVWIVLCSAAIWRFGLDAGEREVLGRTVRGRRSPAAAPEPV
jgi:O-antigen/teichoic acid export membrane protein